MGFLLGAFGKQMAGKRLRSLQARMMRVQSQMRTASRNVETITKQINAQEKAMKNKLSQMSVFMQQGLQKGVTEGNNALLDKLLKEQGVSTPASNVYEAITQLDADKRNSYLAATSSANTEYSQQISSIQQVQAQMQTQMEQEIEWMKEMLLEPAKDEEEELQSEKDSLETQIQLAQQDYEACKEMEKAGAKSFAPEYTGQG